MTKKDYVHDTSIKKNDEQAKRDIKDAATIIAVNQSIVNANTLHNLYCIMGMIEYANENINIINVNIGIVIGPYPPQLSLRLKDNPNLYYYYDWESHLQPGWYDWQNHRPPPLLVEENGTEPKLSEKMSARNGKASKTENATTTAAAAATTDTCTATTTPTTTTTCTSTSQTPVPFLERKKEEQKLLLHQAAAILHFFDTQGLTKSAKKVRLGLAKDLGEEGFARLPEVPAGEWNFIPNDDYESSSSSSEVDEEESSSSSCEDESSSSSSSNDSGNGSESHSASEYEEEMTDEDEDGKAKAKAKAKKGDTDDGPPQRGVSRSKSFDAASRPSHDRNPVKPRRAPPRRTVSFDDSRNKEHILPKREGNKKDLYYDKYDIRRFKMEEQEEKLQESMALAAQTFGLNFMTGKPM